MQRSSVKPVQKWILLGEDDVDDQDFLEEAILEIDAAFTLCSFNTGEKLIAFLQSLTNDLLPCLIVLDYNMPQLNGADILEILKGNHRYHDIPKIVWSTSDSPAYKTSCMELGACDYIVKPSNLSSLTDVARQILSHYNNIETSL
jgi:DNA-binding response OmpR family regulator